MDRTSAITSQLTQIQSWMWVCVPVAFCQWTWLLRLPRTLHIYPILKFVPVFFNLIKVWPIWILLAGYKLNPLRTSCLCALVHLRLTTWEWRQATGSPWNPPLTSPRTTKSHFLRTWAAEMPPCSWWPLISFLLFIFRLWCNVVYVGGAALEGPPGLGSHSCVLALHGVAFGLALLGPRLGVESWCAASLECQTFEVRLVKKEWRVVGVWSNRPLCPK